jgi:hypothetical protein
MVLATLIILSFWAYVADPPSALFNQRLVPFWFLTIHLMAGWLVGYFAYRWVQRPGRKAALSDVYVEGDRIGHEPIERRVPLRSATTPVVTTPAVVPDVYVEALHHRRMKRTAQATVVVAIIGLLSTVPGLIAPVANWLHLNTTGNQVAVWANTNYGGYQAQSGWPEYHDIITTMERVSKRYGCGRAMWEYNSNEGVFGTTEALMILPYWTDNCVDSMEGLLFESSPTTAYHFLNQAELSASPSDAQAGLPYGYLDVKEGVEHLQMFGVKYYMAFSPTVIAQANADPQLKLIASTKAWPDATWRIYLVKNSPMVEGLAEVPNVVANISGRVAWQNANVEWYLNPKLWPTYAASTGPSDWPRAANVTSMTHKDLPSVKVTNIVVGTQSISFHVSRIGVPVLVKISYFPRWHATGATGPFRVSPNLMAVVPTSKDVSMVYGSSPANEIGNTISQFTALAGVVMLVVVLLRRRRPRRVRNGS